MGLLLLDGNVAREFGWVDHASRTDAHDGQAPVCGLAFDGAQRDTQLFGGFGEGEQSSRHVTRAWS